MSKKENPKNPIKKDSTTDFFLNFITRQKSEQKDEEKTTTSKVVDDTVKVRDKAFELFYHMINSLNIFLDRMLQSNLSMKVLSFVLSFSKINLISTIIINNVDWNISYYSFC